MFNIDVLVGGCTMLLYLLALYIEKNNSIFRLEDNFNTIIFGTSIIVMDNINYSKSRSQQLVLT